MNNSPLSSVLLPAVFVSSAIFSTLTIPFALIKSEPVVVELPFYSGEIQPIFNGEHNDVAIPYIGFSIVVSVGAGVATVEVNRRWYQRRKSALAEELPAHLQNFLGEEGEPPEAVKLPEYRPEADMAVAPTTILTTTDFPINNQVLSPQPTIDRKTAKQATLSGVETPGIAAFQGTKSDQSTATSAVSETLNLSQVTNENGSADCYLGLGFNKILESPQEYQTCRIKVPRFERSLFAIEVNNEYYSFFRALETRENVIEVMAKLGSSVQKTAITKTPKSYVIWVLEPEVDSKIA